MTDKSQTTSETDCPDCGRLAHDGECEHPSAWFDRLTDEDAERFIQEGLEAVQKENASRQTTNDQPALAIGQVWVPAKGTARQIINVPRAPGVHYVTLPDARKGWSDGSFMFRDWIRRTHAILQQEKANG